MKINLIRHFATKGNIEKRYVGNTDEGIAKSAIPEQLPLYPQAQMIAASPMKRCTETASIIYNKQNVAYYKELKEYDFGLFEYKTYEELKNNPKYQLWLESRGTVSAPNGESMETFKNRCIKGFQDLVCDAQKAKADTVSVILHGGSIMAILEHFEVSKKNFYEWQIENGRGIGLHLEENEWKKGNEKLMEEGRI